MGEGLRRLYRLPKLTPAPSKKAGVGSYAYASTEKVTMLRLARLMRQAACILTASAVFTLIQASHQLLLTKDWTKVFDALGCVDDVTISYWLLVAASAFDAISSTKNKDVDYTISILNYTESLWASCRLPLLIPVLILAFDCRGAAFAFIGAVKGLFTAAPAVAKPAKRGLAALFA